jgi:phospholipid transport system substrate-binding protein
MMNKRWFLSMFVVLFALTSMVGVQAQTNGKKETKKQISPITMLDTTATQIITALDRNKGSLHNSRVVGRIIRRYLIPKVDVKFMSRFALGRDAWRKASPAQRTQFTKEFTTLVINTYSTAFSQYRNEKVRFKPLRNGYSGKRRVSVKSVIVRRNGPNINVSYRLYSRKSDWRIYDISVEGVSILTSFRSQFAGELRQGSMQQLIKKLGKHNRKVR